MVLREPQTRRIAVIPSTIAQKRPLLGDDASLCPTCRRPIFSTSSSTVEADERSQLGSGNEPALTFNEHAALIRVAVAVGEAMSMPELGVLVFSRLLSCLTFTESATSGPHHSPPRFHSQHWQCKSEPI